jgi:hypothetical protein
MLASERKGLLWDLHIRLGRGKLTHDLVRVLDVLGVALPADAFGLEQVDDRGDRRGIGVVILGPIGPSVRIVDKTKSIARNGNDVVGLGRVGHTVAAGQEDALVPKFAHVLVVEYVGACRILEQNHDDVIKCLTHAMPPDLATAV